MTENTLLAKHAFNILKAKPRSRKRPIERELGGASGINLQVLAIVKQSKEVIVKSTAATLIVLSPLSDCSNRVQFTSAETAGLTAMPVNQVINPEKLKSVRFVGPSSLELIFSDRTFELPIERLEMPLDRIDWLTVVASPNGEKITVKGVKGDLVPIDSSTLRYLVDEKYAASIDEQFRRLQFTDDELKNLSLNEPPPGFFDGPEGFTRESWK